MKTYITTSFCVARKIDSRGVRWEMGTVRKDTKFNSTGENQFGYINFNGTSWWIPANRCKLADVPQLPPLEFPNQYQYARIKGIADRGDAMKNYPDVISLRDLSYATAKKGNSIPVTIPCWNAIERNNDAAGYKYAKTSQASWINLPGDEPREIDILHEKTNAESIGFGGNLVALTERKNKRWKILARSYTFDFDTIGPNDHLENPYLWWIPRSIDKYGRIYRVANGVIAYLPHIAYTELWIDESQLQLYSEPPKSWAPEDVFSPDAIG